MALVAPANESADNILRWGGDTASSRMSWYYRGGGIDGEMKRRVEAAGGRYEECEIRCSLRWDNEEPNRMSGTDLDLHCQTPYGEHIYYGAKRDRTGGYLDVDANANGRRTSETPVENIRWAEGMAKNGHYHFYVHNYKQMDRRFNAYTVELQVGDKTWTFDAEAMGTGYRMIAFDFDYWDGAVRNLMIRGRTESEAARVAATSGGMVWNVAKNQFVTVKGIVTSPNMWGENPMPQIGEHAFFLMEDCRDDGEHKHAGFIPETLIPALTEHRRTLQAYTSMVEIDGGEDADACGMGFGTFGDWNLILRVTMKDGARRIVKIDRFD